MAWSEAAPFKSLSPGNRTGVMVMLVRHVDPHKVVKIYLPCGRFCPRPLPHIVPRKSNGVE